MYVITEKGLVGSPSDADGSMSIHAEIECHSCGASTTGTLTITDEMVKRPASWLGGDTERARSVLSAAFGAQRGDGS